MGRHRSAVRLTPRENLELFVVRVEELFRMRIILNQGLSSSWSFSIGMGRPAVFSAASPDEEDLRSYLLAFRKFISKDEPLFLGYVHNLCQKSFTSDELKSNIRKCQQDWRVHCVQGGIKLTINGSEIQPEYVADLWINGHYFHDDIDKAAELRNYVPDHLFLVRQHFLDFVVEATRVIGGTGYAIKMALRDGALRDSA